MVKDLSFWSKMVNKSEYFLIRIFWICQDLPPPLLTESNKNKCFLTPPLRMGSSVHPMPLVSAPCRREQTPYESRKLVCAFSFSVHDSFGKNRHIKDQEVEFLRRLSTRLYKFFPENPLPGQIYCLYQQKRGVRGQGTC